MSAEPEKTIFMNAAWTEKAVYDAWCASAENTYGLTADDWEVVAFNAVNASVISAITADTATDKQVLVKNVGTEAIAASAFKMDISNGTKGVNVRFEGKFAGGTIQDTNKTAGLDNTGNSIFEVSGSGTEFTSTEYLMPIQYRSFTTGDPAEPVATGVLKITDGATFTAATNDLDINLRPSASIIVDNATYKGAGTTIYSGASITVQNGGVYEAKTGYLNLFDKSTEAGYDIPAGRASTVSVLTGGQLTASYFDIDPVAGGIIKVDGAGSSIKFVDASKMGSDAKPATAETTSTIELSASNGGTFTMGTLNYQYGTINVTSAASLSVTGALTVKAVEGMTADKKTVTVTNASFSAGSFVVEENAAYTFNVNLGAKSKFAIGTLNDTVTINVAKDTTEGAVLKEAYLFKGVANGSQLVLSGDLNTAGYKAIDSGDNLIVTNRTDTVIFAVTTGAVATQGQTLIKDSEHTADESFYVMLDEVENNSTYFKLLDAGSSISVDKITLSDDMVKAGYKIVTNDRGTFATTNVPAVTLYAHIDWTNEDAYKAWIADPTNAATVEKYGLTDTMFGTQAFDSYANALTYNQGLYNPTVENTLILLSDFTPSADKDAYLNVRIKSGVEGGSVISGTNLGFWSYDPDNTVVNIEENVTYKIGNRFRMGGTVNLYGTITQVGDGVPSGDRFFYVRAFEGYQVLNIYNGHLATGYNSGPGVRMDINVHGDGKEYKDVSTTDLAKVNANWYMNQQDTTAPDSFNGLQIGGYVAGENSSLVIDQYATVYSGAVTVIGFNNAFKTDKPEPGTQRGTLLLDTGKLIVNNKGMYVGYNGVDGFVTIENNSILEAKSLTVNDTGSITQDTTSTVKITDAITVAEGGSYTLDVSGFTAGADQTFSLLVSAASGADTITVTGADKLAEGWSVYQTTDKVFLSNADMSTIMVDASFTGDFGATVKGKDGKEYSFGINAFADYLTGFKMATNAAATLEEVTLVSVGDHQLGNPGEESSWGIPANEKVTIKTLGLDGKAGGSVKVNHYFIQNDGCATTIDVGSILLLNSASSPRLRFEGGTLNLDGQLQTISDSVIDFDEPDVDSVLNISKTGRYQLTNGSYNQQRKDNISFTVNVTGEKAAEGTGYQGKYKTDYVNSVYSVTLDKALEAGETLTFYAGKNKVTYTAVAGEVADQLEAIKTALATYFDGEIEGSVLTLTSIKPADLDAKATATLSKLPNMVLQLNESESTGSAMLKMVTQGDFQYQFVQGSGTQNAIGQASYNSTNVVMDLNLTNYATALFYSVDGGPAANVFLGSGNGNTGRIKVSDSYINAKGQKFISGNGTADVTQNTAVLTITGDSLVETAGIDFTKGNTTLNIGWNSKMVYTDQISFGKTTAATIDLTGFDAATTTKIYVIVDGTAAKTGFANGSSFELKGGELTGDWRFVQDGKNVYITNVNNDTVTLDGTIEADKRTLGTDINGKVYGVDIAATVQEAVDAVKDGGTITVGASVTESDAVVTIKKDVTINIAADQTVTVKTLNAYNGFDVDINGSISGTTLNISDSNVTIDDKKFTFASISNNGTITVDATGVKLTEGDNYYFIRAGKEAGQSLLSGSGKYEVKNLDLGDKWTTVVDKSGFYAAELENVYREKIAISTVWYDEKGQVITTPAQEQSVFFNGTEYSYGVTAFNDTASFETVLPDVRQIGTLTINQVPEGGTALTLVDVKSVLDYTQKNAVLVGDWSESTDPQTKEVVIGDYDLEITGDFEDNNALRVNWTKSFKVDGNITGKSFDAETGAIIAGGSINAEGIRVKSVTAASIDVGEHGTITAETIYSSGAVTAADINGNVEAKTIICTKVGGNVVAYGNVTADGIGGDVTVSGADSVVTTGFIGGSFAIEGKLAGTGSSFQVYGKSSAGTIDAGSIMLIDNAVLNVNTLTLDDGESLYATKASKIFVGKELQNGNVNSMLDLSQTKISFAKDSSIIGGKYIRMTVDQLMTFHADGLKIQAATEGADVPKVRLVDKITLEQYNLVKDSYVFDFAGSTNLVQTGIKDLTDADALIDGITKVEATTGNDKLDVKSGELDRAGITYDMVGGKNTVSVGADGTLKLAGLKNIASLTTKAGAKAGEETFVNITDGIQTSAGKGTLSFGNFNKVVIGGKWDETAQKYVADGEEGIKVSDLGGSNAVTFGNGSDVQVFGGIEAISKLTLGKDAQLGLAPKESKLSVTGKVTGQNTNNTVSFGDGSEVNIDGGLDLMGGKNTVTVGKFANLTVGKVPSTNAYIAAAVASGITTLKLTAGTYVAADSEAKFTTATINGKLKMSAAANTINMGNYSKLTVEGDIDNGGVNSATGSTIKVGKNAILNVKGGIDGLTKLDIAASEKDNKSTVEINGKIEGTFGNSVINLGAGAQVRVDGTIDLKGGTNKITLAKGAMLNGKAGEYAVDIRNVSTLSIANDTNWLADPNFNLKARYINTAEGKVTVSFGNFSKVNVEYGIEASALGSLTTVSIGTNAIVTFGGNLNSITKLTVANGKALKVDGTSTQYYSRLQAGDVTGTVGNDTITIGNFANVNFCDVNLGAGKNTLSVGNSSFFEAAALNGATTLKTGANTIFVIGSLKGAGQTQTFTGYTGGAIVMEGKATITTGKASTFVSNSITAADGVTISVGASSRFIVSESGELSYTEGKFEGASDAVFADITGATKITTANNDKSATLSDDGEYYINGTYFAANDVKGTDAANTFNFGTGTVVVNNIDMGDDAKDSLTFGKNARVRITGTIEGADKITIGDKSVIRGSSEAIATLSKANKIGKDVSFFDIGAADGVAAAFTTETEELADNNLAESTAVLKAGTNGWLSNKVTADGAQVQFYKDTIDNFAVAGVSGNVVTNLKDWQITSDATDLTVKVSEKVGGTWSEGEVINGTDGVWDLSSFTASAGATDVKISVSLAETDVEADQKIVSYTVSKIA